MRELSPSRHVTGAAGGRVLPSLFHRWRWRAPLRLDGPYGSRDRRGGGAGLTLSLPPVASDGELSPSRRPVRVT